MKPALATDKLPIDMLSRFNLSTIGYTNCRSSGLDHAATIALEVPMRRHRRDDELTTAERLDNLTVDARELKDQLTELSQKRVNRAIRARFFRDMTTLIIKLIEDLSVEESQELVKEAFQHCLQLLNPEADVEKMANAVWGDK
jgi:hypothetical protein